MGLGLLSVNQGQCLMKVLYPQGVMNTPPALVGSTGVSTGVALR
jgi:hypothetical protein